MLIQQFHSVSFSVIQFYPISANPLKGGDAKLLV